LGLYIGKTVKINLILKPLAPSDHMIRKYFPVERFWVWLIPSTILLGLLLVGIQFIIIFGRPKRINEPLQDENIKEKIN
jgi:hypothetical protein